MDLIFFATVNPVLLDRKVTINNVLVVGLYAKEYKGMHETKI